MARRGSLVSTRILGRTMRDAVRKKEGGKGAVRLPKIIVLASGLLHARRAVGKRTTLLTLSGYSGTVLKDHTA